MRCFASLLILLVALPAVAQEPAYREEPGPRFGIPYLSGLYPQTSPKAALASTVKAIDKERYDYVVAHLMDEAFVETRIGSRALEIRRGVDVELKARRERQRQDPAAVAPEEKLSMEPKAFAAAVDTEVRTRAYREVVKDVRDKLDADPEEVKELKRFARDGVVAEAGDTATISLRDVRDRKVYLKKVNGRWFVENRQADDTPKSDKQLP